MTISKYLLSFALLLGLGACDKDESAAPESADAVEVESADEHGPRGKLAKLDADKDGAISLAEAKGHRLEHKFAELDADKDGKLSEGELAALKHGGWHGKGRGKDPEKRADHLLAKLDADRDGSISQAEAADSKFAGKFADADADKDGKLTRAELVAMKLEHGGWHGKGPGDRHHKDPAEKAAFMIDKFDADKDGSISQAEVEGSRFADKFADADANKDGKVTRDELVAYKTARAAEHDGEGRGRGKHGEGHGRGGPR
jgi:Ca2+-binding EF-hand superfamily protein